MLTRLQVRGFKNLLEFDIRFGPFTCIAGPNGAGKSNIFDAIRFRRLLTEHPIMEAVQRLRETKGRSPEPHNLFTSFGNHREEQMSFTADIIVGRKAQDDFGVSAEASISTLRYEVAFRIEEDDGIERLVLDHESLERIRLSDARKAIKPWAKRPFYDSCISGRRQVPFISTSSSDEGNQITVHQEGHGGGGRKVLASNSSRTIIGGLASSEFPTVLAAHREMQTWQTLMLEPSAMRAPSLYRDPREIDDRGANLPSSLDRLVRAADNPGHIESSIINRLSELIEDVRELRVKDDPVTETLTLEVQGQDGVFHPARSLSDGTLRFLVLSTLAEDPKAQGIICLEEPENGIHPERIPAIVKLLRDIAVDAEEETGADNPLRQVVVNTHSPDVFRNVDPCELVYVGELRKYEGDSGGNIALQSVPKHSWRWKAAVEGSAYINFITPGQMQAYLGIPPRQLQLWLPFTEQA